MKYTVNLDKSMYITDEIGKMCASLRAVTMGAETYDLFISPKAGVNHHIQLHIEEIVALADMLTEIAEDAS